MPGGFVALCVNSGGVRHQLEKSKVLGDFSKVEFTPNFDTITGKLTIFFDTYRLSHGGITVRLEGQLDLKTENWSIFRHCPTETVLSSGGDLVHGRKRLNFHLNIPPRKAHPTPFVTSNGSLTYRLYAFIKRDDSWDIITDKLINFKGYHNVQYMDCNPFVESKMIRTKEAGEVVAMFRVPNTVAIMGHSDEIEAILELQGIVESRVEATLTFFRNIRYEGNVHTEVILSQNRQADAHQSVALFKWTIVVPPLKRISFSDKLIPSYSVRYYLKYEVSLGSSAVVNGAAEVVIGTTRDLCGSETKGSGATDQSRRRSSIELPQTGRRNSVMSLLSMLSLPPAYSMLSSMAGSTVSLETLPPDYDEIKHQ